jgi:hypothetical protein
MASPMAPGAIPPRGFARQVRAGSRVLSLLLLHTRPAPVGSAPLSLEGRRRRRPSTRSRSGRGLTSDCSFPKAKGAQRSSGGTAQRSTSSSLSGGSVGTRVGRSPRRQPARAAIERATEASNRRGVKPANAAHAYAQLRGVTPGVGAGGPSPLVPAIITAWCEREQGF